MALETIAEEIVNVSVEIYNFLLLFANLKKQALTLVCGGQSPAYFALAILNLKIYRPEIVEVVVLPYSKKGLIGDVVKESYIYKRRLDEAGFQLRRCAIILDYILSGVGIRSLKKTLEICYPDTNVGLISINQTGSTHMIPVYRQFTASCMSFLLKREQRIVQTYTPLHFTEEKIKLGFINLEHDDLATIVLQKCVK
jgi:hypothetical protein